MAGERYSKYGITQAYGEKNSAYSKGYNRGQDYGMPLGTDVEGDAGGEVVAVTTHPQWGLYVQVRDGNGYVHQYSHLDAAGVSVGQRVSAGEIVGQSGYSGWTIPAGPDGAHLDYMVLDPGGNDINPGDYSGAEDEEAEFYNPQPEPEGPQPGGNMAEPQVGDKKTEEFGGGKVQDFIFQEWTDERGQHQAAWVETGPPYFRQAPKEPKEPFQGTTPGERAGASAAERQHEAEQGAAARAATKALQDSKNAVDREISDLDRQSRETIAKINDAFARDNLAEASRQFGIKQALDERLADARIRSQDLQDQLSKAGVTGFYEGQPTLTREQVEAQIRQRERELGLREGELTGYINGKPTLSREEYEAKLANEPGNVYNYLFRSRGQEPVGPQPTGEARPWWENYSNERLMRFPDEELMTLPPAVLAGFPNQFFLKRPALLAFLPPERIRGEGQWEGVGFADEVIDKYGQGAPVPKEVQNVGKAYQEPTSGIGTAVLERGPQPAGTATQPVAAPAPQYGGTLGPAPGQAPPAQPRRVQFQLTPGMQAARNVQTATPTPAPQPMGQQELAQQAMELAEQVRREMAGGR